MEYTPDKKSWATVAGVRQPRMEVLAGVERARQGVGSGHVQHKLGFNDAEAIPFIMDPRQLFDAFQDTDRTGKLPTQLNEGSMPLYFCMNRKFIDSFEHTRNRAPGTKGVAALSAPMQRGPLAALAEHDTAGYLRCGLKSERPTSAAGPRADPDAAAPEWQVVRSKSKGFPYWYNRRTGESRWVAPDTPESVRDRGDPTGPDRAWFSMQAGLGAELRPESTGLTMNAVVFDQRQRPDFQVEERRPHRKVLQRRALRSDTYEERASDRWLGSSFPPAGRASAEDKLLRLISDKAFEHSTTRGAMREAFFKIDKEKSGAIDAAELREVVEAWLGMRLDDAQLRAVLRKFNPRGDGQVAPGRPSGSGARARTSSPRVLTPARRRQIRYLDLVVALEENGHPLGQGPPQP